MAVVRRFQWNQYPSINAMFQDISQYVTPLALREIDGNGQAALNALLTIKGFALTYSSIISVYISTRIVPRNGIIRQIENELTQLQVPIGVGRQIAFYTQLPNNPVEFFRIKIEGKISDNPTQTFFCSPRY